MVELSNLLRSSILVVTFACISSSLSQVITQTERTALVAYGRDA